MTSVSLLIFLTTSFASAFPIRVGESFGYRVWRGWESDSTHATLTVQKDSLTDSGTIWTIGIRDSLLNGNRIRSTTALLRTTAFDTVWHSPSCLAAWDLADSVPTPDTGHYISGGLVPARGGILAAACFGTGVPDTTTWKVPTGYNPIRWEANRRALGWILDLRWFDLPSSIHVPGTGMVRLRDTVSKEEWKLVERNGETPSGISRWNSAARLLAELRVGESWTWSVEASSDRITKWGGDGVPLSLTTDLAWILQATDEDSSGWIRRTVRSRCLLDSLADSALSLRIEPISGEVRVSSSNEVLRRVAGGMVGRWFEIQDGEDLWTRRVALEWNESIRSGFDSLETISKVGIGTVEVRHRANAVLSNSASERSSLSILLRSHDGIPSGIERGGSDRNRPGSLFRSLRELESALSSDPGAVVRWGDATGRSSIQDGAKALEALQTRRGLVFVEMRGRSGIRRGRLILP